jgi:amino acid adenylation domain-containing protein/non-ribosomal peptide synthase protein (TIGR01720 family)
MTNKKTIQSSINLAFQTHSQSTALEYGDYCISYAQLEQLSAKICQWLISKGIQPETFIGIYTTDRVQLISAIIGILRAGCVFVPLDPALPLTRLRGMVDTIQLKWVICEGQNGSFKQYIDEQGAQLISFDAILAGESMGTNPLPLPEYSGEDRIYVYFTSGTTGTPKAIVGKNKSLRQFIHWEIEIFSIEPGTRVSQFITPGFDAFLRDVFVALCSGGTLCIPHDNKILMDSSKLVQWIDDERVNVIHCVPSLFAMFNRAELTPGHFKELKNIMMSGEKIEPASLVNWYAVFGERIQLINFYGPTETTMIKIYYLITQADLKRERMPIGQPMKGARVIILDKELKMCDEGMTGEIYIRTPFRTFGYYNDEAANKLKFIVNPLNTDPGDFIFKTGDLGRILPGGLIEFLGRKDRQVKIRGVRVELEEIEWTLKQHKEIDEAVVLVKNSNTPGSQTQVLCAALVVRDEIDFKAYLIERLPAYMVPAYFQTIDRIPRKPNGKIDYDALLDLFNLDIQEYIDPQNPAQEKLLKAWQEVLPLEQIGITNSFFKLGGNSLHVLTLISSIQRDFDIKLTLAEFFAHDTIEKQSALLAEKGDYIGSDLLANIKPLSNSDYYPLSSVQRRLFFLQQLDQSNTSYNIPMAIIMAGNYDIARINQVVRQLIQRHESLRTSFQMIDGDPLQKIHDTVDFEVETLSHKVTPGQKSNHIYEALIERFIRPFDLSDAPLFRVGFWQERDDRMLVLLDFHHIIFDGTSQALFTSEFMSLYRGEALLPLALQYKDYSGWQNQEAQIQSIRQQGQYWIERFSGQLPLLDLPHDFQRPLVQSFDGGAVNFELTKQQTRQLNQLALHHDATLYITLLALFNVLLAHLSRSDEIIIGTSIAGRRHPDLSPVIGMFVNALAMRNYPKGDKPFSQFLQEVKQNTLQDFENQDYPFEELVEHLGIQRIPGRNPVFDVMMVLNNEEMPTLDLSGIQVTGYTYEKRAAQMDLKLRMIELKEKLYCSFEYSSALFKPETVTAFQLSFEEILSEVLQNPDTCIKDLKLTSRIIEVDGRLSIVKSLSDSERHELLYDFNNTHTSYPTGKNIHQWFEAQVSINPGRTAVIDAKGQEISYKDLNEQSNRLARLLRKKGVSSDTVVGLMMARSIASVSGMLAILKAGGAYLPIDTGLPKERVRYMLEDSGAQLLLSNTDATEEISFTELQGLQSGKEIQLVMTPLRNHIKDFNGLPIPDRSFIDMSNYRDKIGMASVANNISLQTTRGCPYECLFCHKVWSKRHVFRSAENILAEVKEHYRQGVRNFSIIDDCFNLNIENSQRLFRLLRDSDMEVQLFFPNGLRGDLLTFDYIDLMVEAGTRGINLSLETASPRLQKLVKKNLDIPKFKENIQYIANQHPHVILEIATMHGFPTETQEEALMTLDFIKSIKWIHFPYIHILKIYPNTEMEELALHQGVSKEDIIASKDLAFHELPETLPFPKSFTRKYQADFLNDYFLNQDRLLKVLPLQLEVMSEAALIEKYNAYLPTPITGITDLLQLAGLKEKDLATKTLKHKKPGGTSDYRFPVPPDYRFPVPPAAEKGSGKKKSYGLPVPPVKKKILLLDLSQHFSSYNMLYNVVEQPLGLISLMTYITQELGDHVTGKIYKSGIDFDSFQQLKELLDRYQPDLIGIRTLTFYKEFFHETVSLLRQWGIQAPIVAGGPYATSDYDSILKDSNVNLVIFGEGEHTFKELLEKMLQKNDTRDFLLPDEDVLRKIHGLVFATTATDCEMSLELLLPDKIQDLLALEYADNLEPTAQDDHLAYVMYTSGSTGKPKGVMVEHRQVNNCIHWMQDTFKLDASSKVVQRTNLTFDPSVWEIFWPLYQGASLQIIDNDHRRDVAYLVRLMEESESNGLTLMYCPSTLLNAIVHYLEMNSHKPRLKMPWLIIGAEPVSMDVIKRLYAFYEGKIVNTYGPTEGTINNTFYHLEPNDTRTIVPIGKPIANNQVYILGNDLKLLPKGTVGEICLAGDSLARGYINNRDMTLTHFMPNTFGPGKLYRTGDVGRWLEDGNIEIMGRVDDQVKIRGFRIELGEIENTLNNHPAIHESVVVAKTREQLKEQVRECKICGIWSNYPGIKVNNEQVCNICENLSLYKNLIDQYFLTPQDFELKIREGNKNSAGKYDCVLVYACERVATYALYKLLDMGFKVLTVTYDSGHYDQSSLDRIKRITSNLGVDHIFLRHDKSNEILKESLKVAKTMCKGCIHTSSSLAGEHAYKHNIKYVIGETLSRGQIVENKLFKFLDAGIHDVNEIEREVKNLMRNVASMDKSIYDIIDIDLVKNGSLYDKVEFIDFYRYFDISHEEMGIYLDEKDVYWKNLENRAAYSTDCKICQVGDFNHMKELGYHYTGSAKSWEKRLGQATMRDVKDDLKLTMSPQEHAQFLENLGYKEELNVEKKEKHLCAYYVQKGPLETDLLRDYLHSELPEYMVPTYYVALDRIPLTPNGKIDRKALPSPELMDRGSQQYVAPETHVEERLRDVWQEVLGVDDIGVNDDLFKLGGDSIKAIRISSKLQRFNLKLEIKDLFQNPTIKKSAHFVESMDNMPRVDQEPVTGMVPLAPVQHWFFESVTVDPHHFNQSLMLYREQGFDEELVKKVFRKIIQHHDALRIQFRGFHDINQTGPGMITQMNQGIDDINVDLEVIPLNRVQQPAGEKGVRQEIGDKGTRLEKDNGVQQPAGAGEKGVRQEIDVIAQRIQQSFQPQNGPLIKLALFKSSKVKGVRLEKDIGTQQPAGEKGVRLENDNGVQQPAGAGEKGVRLENDYLLIAVHHLVVDGISWRILLEDFEIGYLQASEGGDIQFQSKTHSYKYWAQQLSLYAQSETALRELPYWREVETRAAQLEPLPKDYHVTPDQRLLKESQSISLQLDESETRQLLKEVHTAYNTQINDLLLAALVLTINPWTRQNRTLITLEGHGRETLLEGIDINRTIGWFTSQFPILLDTPNADAPDLAEVLKGVKETMRKVPNKGTGYGVLRYLTHEQKMQGAVLRCNPEIIFNYLGQVGDGSTITGDVFNFSSMPVGEQRSPQAPIHHALSIDAIVQENKLSATFTFNTCEYDAGTIASLVENYKVNLLRLIALCIGVESPEMTVSDFDALDLDEEEVDAIYDELELE